MWHFITSLSAHEKTLKVSIVWGILEIWDKNKIKEDTNKKYWDINTKFNKLLMILWVIVNSMKMGLQKSDICLK